MVTALYVIAPVPPVYDRAVGMPLRGASEQTRGQRHRFTRSLYTFASDEEYAESIPVPENARETSELESPARIAYAADYSERGGITAILNLYEQCKQALRTIKVHVPERHKEEITLAKALSLLKLWGTDMFDGDTALDKVLRMEDVWEEEECDPIRAAVISVLIDIAMIEGKFPTVTEGRNRWADNCRDCARISGPELRGQRPAEN